MKSVLTVIALCLMTSVLSQTASLSGNVETKGVKVEKIKIEKVKIQIEVDSAEDIESTFLVTDFEDILNESNADEELIFKITCNGEKMSNGEKSSLSYEVKGNTNDKSDFLQKIDKIRKSAIKYYKSKE